MGKRTRAAGSGAPDWQCAKVPGLADDWLDSWMANVDTHAAQVVNLAGTVAAVSGVAQNSNGSVKIAVGSGGQVQDLHLDDSACDLGGPQLARQIMSVMRAAQADMADRVTDAVHATVGVGSELGRAVLETFNFGDTGISLQNSDSDANDGHRDGVCGVRVREGA